MEFTRTAADAMTWETLTEAAKRIEALWEFGDGHELRFSRRGPRRRWVCYVIDTAEATPLGYIRPFIVRGGQPRFQ